MFKKVQSSNITAVHRLTLLAVCSGRDVRKTWFVLFDPVFLEWEGHWRPSTTV